MANKVLVQALDGTPKQLVFGDHAGDFNPTAANDLRVTTDGSFETDVQMIFASVADGAARQSAKFDFGENRATKYAIRAALEFASGLAAGDTSYIYIGYSPSVTAANKNPGNLSGSDAAYTGYSSNLADSLFHLELIGVIRQTAQVTATIQVAEAGIFYPRERYASIVYVAADDMHTDDVECHIVFDPIVDEVQ
jgi:hypothetical protein